ncbi:thioredoxin family protein [bacterium]|nr:thioredoxin family protein [bacterium]
MKSILVLLAMLLTLTACQKGQDKNKIEVKTPTQEETAAVDTEVEVTETAETATEPEEGTVMPEDDGIWTVNMDFAKKIAKEKDLNLLILFTGSDWCHWCKKLNEEVFSQDEFQQEVVKQFVPVKLDFPSAVKFPEEIRKSYEAEMKKYGVRGYPTVVLTDCEGNAFAVCGYQPGGAEGYLTMLNNLVEGKKELDAKVAELKDGDAAAASELYNILEEYSEKFKDPCIKEGLKKYYDICREKCPEISRALEREEKIKQRLAEIDEQYKIGEGYDPSEATPEKAEQAVADYQAVIDSFKLEGEKKQEVLLKIALVYTIVQEDEKAQEYLDKAVEAAPDSEFAEMIKERRAANEIEELMENVNQMVIDDKKDDALKAIDERLEKEEDMNNKIELTSVKAEIQVLFDDIEGAKENFNKCIEMCGNEEATEQFKTRLNELDPFNKTVTQSQLLSLRGDPKGMIEAIDKAIEQYNPDPASLQKALFMQAQAYMEAGDQAKAEETIRKTIEAAPETDLAQMLSEQIKRMEQMKAAQEKMMQERKAQAEKTEEAGE